MNHEFHLSVRLTKTTNKLLDIKRLSVKFPSLDIPYKYYSFCIPMEISLQSDLTDQPHEGML